MASSDDSKRLNENAEKGIFFKGDENLCYNVVDNVRHAIHVIDKNLKFRIFNAAFKKWCRELELDITDIENKTVFELFSFLPDRVREEYLKVFETGEIVITEEKSVVGGKKVITETHKYPLRVNRQIKYVVTVVHDITLQRLAEEELRFSEERYRLLFESVNANIALIDYNGKFVIVNESTARGFGLKADQMINRTMWEFFPKNVAERQMKTIRKAISRNRLYHEEAETLVLGKTRWYEVKIQPYRIGTKKPNAALVIAHDITGRKQAEVELKRTRNELEVRVKSRTDELAETNEQLRREREALKEKNIALQEILNQIEASKQQVGKQIQMNINRLIIPLLNSLSDKFGDEARSYTELLKENLKNITSPFIKDLESKYTHLSPREVEICNMVRGGMTCKNIANTLNISVQTVLKQRAQIRKKLGITNEKINLATFLRSEINTRS